MFLHFRLNGSVVNDFHSFKIKESRWLDYRNPLWSRDCFRNKFRRAGDERFCYQLDESNLVPVFERNVIKANCSRGNSEERCSLVNTGICQQGGRYTLETRTFAKFSKLPIRSSTCLLINFVISFSRENLLQAAFRVN